METVYPARLTFALADDVGKAGAIIDAARDLQLPFEVDGPQHHVVVVVDSALTAYRFGVPYAGTPGGALNGDSLAHS